MRNKRIMHKLFLELAEKLDCWNMQALQKKLSLSRVVLNYVGIYGNM